VEFFTFQSLILTSFRFCLAIWQTVRVNSKFVFHSYHDTILCAALSPHQKITASSPLQLAGRALARRRCRAQPGIESFFKETGGSPYYIFLIKDINKMFWNAEVLNCFFTS
jgi:hypothetical protein